VILTLQLFTTPAANCTFDSALGECSREGWPTPFVATMLKVESEATKKEKLELKVFFEGLQTKSKKLLIQIFHRKKSNPAEF
jgi:hypothetical protein